jgi:hypothetical protein
MIWPTRHSPAGSCRTSPPKWRVLSLDVELTGNRLIVRAHLPIAAADRLGELAQTGATAAPASQPSFSLCGWKQEQSSTSSICPGLGRWSPVTPASRHRTPIRGRACSRWSRRAIPILPSSTDCQRRAWQRPADPCATPSSFWPADLSRTRRLTGGAPILRRSRPTRTTGRRPIHVPHPCPKDESSAGRVFRRPSFPQDEFPQDEFPRDEPPDAWSSGISSWRRRSSR